MATKWIDTIKCQWCGGEARAGIERDGLGSTYRVICRSCGISEQAGMAYPAGQKIAELLTENEAAEEEPLPSVPPGAGDSTKSLLDLWWQGLRS